jgi:hypothetical protein
MINQKRVLTLYTDNVERVLMEQFRISPDYVSQMVVHGEPVFLVAGVTDNGIAVERGFILFPSEFVVRAMKKPIEVLATMANMASQVNDIANNRLHIDQPFMEIRGYAFESDFLHYAKSMMPDVLLGDIYERAMREYPRGMDSLPLEARYSPYDAGSMFLNAALN